MIHPSFMNRLFLTGFLIVALGLGGCSKKFSPLYQKAQKSFQEKNYVDTVDTMTLALHRWTDEDGNEVKAQAYQLLGKSYHELRKLDKAVDAYQQAVQLSENTFESAYSLGVIQLTAGQAQLAAKSFMDALRMKKDDPQALLGLGNALYTLQKYKDAQLVYEKVLDVSPGVRESMEYLKLIRDRGEKKKRTIVSKPPKRVPGSIKTLKSKKRR